MKFRHAAAEIEGLPTTPVELQGWAVFQNACAARKKLFSSCPMRFRAAAAISFSAITALIVRQRPRGACRERRKRGQSGHEEDERFKIGGQGPRMVHERSPATLHLRSRPPNRFKMAFRPHFGMFLPHHDPKSPYSPVNFVCIYPIEPTEDCPGFAGARLIEVLR